MSSALGMIQFKTVGGGYAALNLAGKAKGLEILELSPLGGQCHLIVRGETASVHAFIVELRTGDISRSVVLSDYNEILLRSYLSLESAKLQKFILVLECNFVGDMFQKAQELLGLGLSIFDMRVFRGSGSPNYLLMTGDDADVAQRWVEANERALVGSSFKIELITQLSEGFCHFVDLKV